MSDPKDEARLQRREGKRLPASSPERADLTLLEKKKELSLRLFDCFLKIMGDGADLEWRSFQEELESSLWEEALKLANGNGKEAAALIGVPYSTFMRRCRPGRNGPSAAEDSSLPPDGKVDRD